MSVDAVNDDRLATDGAAEVCSHWLLRAWRREHEQLVADIAETRRLYDDMRPLVEWIDEHCKDASDG